MILFFKSTHDRYHAVVCSKMLSTEAIQKLSWLLGKGSLIEAPIAGNFVAPRKGMVSPWSTNAVEIVHTMGISDISRIEEFIVLSDGTTPDPLLQQHYKQLHQGLFDNTSSPERQHNIKDIAAYNLKEGLALSQEDIDYLEKKSHSLERPLTDSEVFGFAQINSEHCRHKIFNGTFIIDGQKKPYSPFQIIKKTVANNDRYIISAYKDNVAFISGPKIVQFAPSDPTLPSYFRLTDIDSVISIKAETHNFPVTVEPFNGAATGSGGEIRDRMAGGQGSIPLAGTAVYMTSYPRLGSKREWEKKWAPRAWKYQSPTQILIKASDGASDFGNKFGQPLICGSLLTFEHIEKDKRYGFDKAIMLAGGVGFGKAQDSKKKSLTSGDKIIVIGGDNYRIGMGGGSVSSMTTSKTAHNLEWKAIQRANPEMQKRVMNTIRALVEMSENPIRSIHDHGAGGHLNCFVELLEHTGGTIEIDKLPKGDPSLSYKELLSNESQERMGMIIDKKHIDLVEQIAHREKTPLYVVGTVTQDGQFRCIDHKKNIAPVDLTITDLLGPTPKTTLYDNNIRVAFDALTYNTDNWRPYLDEVLQLESVACKDWLTNKVDRSVTGKVATQQTCGEIQLPLNNVGVIAFDFTTNRGIANAIGHAPAAGLIDPEIGSRLAIARALTNIVWAPLTHGLKGVSLSANWMWPARNKGEDVRLYKAVEAASTFAQQLGITIPTGKDSLSMTQRYMHDEIVYAPGTVIISAVAEVSDISRTVSPCLADIPKSTIFYIPFSNGDFQLGGSSLGQVLNRIGQVAPDVSDSTCFSNTFHVIQQLINERKVLAGHDIAAGGLITTLLEMCFPTPKTGLTISINTMGTDAVKILFGENPGLVIQTDDEKRVVELSSQQGVDVVRLGIVTKERVLQVQSNTGIERIPIDIYRDKWFSPSYWFDKLQRPAVYATKRRQNYAKQPLQYVFPPSFDGRLSTYSSRVHNKNTSIKAAVIREKGINGDRELAYALHLAGFDVKDVHMTDLITGRETLSDIHLIAFAGGFSHSDVFRSAKGWAGSFLYNPKAKAALDNFYARQDTLTLGVCNGCQLMMELGVIYPTWHNHPIMHRNGSGKFESAFVNVHITESNSIMLRPLKGARLGVWIAHGEGRFDLQKDPSKYRIAAQYSYSTYPGNPNDSDFSTAALVSKDGRHLAIMPHIERSLFPWNWPYYPKQHEKDEISPWIEAITSGYSWIRKNRE